MQAVILAAGKGTRTYPLTATRPKPLLTAANKTIIEHNLEQLDGLVQEAIIVIGYMGEMIKQKLGNYFGKIKLTYVEQTEQLGSGHALMLAKEHIDERFIVLNGDDFYSREDIKNCLKHYYCVLGQKVKDPENWGIFKLKEGNNVEKLVERPKEFVSDLANTGLYVLDNKVFEIDLQKSERGEFEIVDFITEIAKQYDVYCETVKDYWFPVRFAWDLLNINEFFLNKIKKSIKGDVEKGVYVHGTLVVGEGTVVKSGTYIEGNVMIGKNCKIGPNCYIRGSTSIGNNCHIGQAVELKNSIVMDNSNVPHLNYVGDSIIGEKTNLGAGTIVANLRHDNGNVKTVVKGELIDTGRRKLGTIIGNNVHTGINTSIYPGRKIWPNKATKPGEVVQKDIV